MNRANQAVLVIFDFLKPHHTSPCDTAEFQHIQRGRIAELHNSKLAKHRTTHLQIPTLKQGYTHSAVTIFNLWLGLSFPLVILLTVCQFKIHRIHSPSLSPPSSQLKLHGMLCFPPSLYCTRTSVSLQIAHCLGQLVQYICITIHLFFIMLSLDMHIMQLSWTLNTWTTKCLLPIRYLPYHSMW